MPNPTRSTKTERKRSERWRLELPGLPGAEDSSVVAAITVPRAGLDTFVFRLHRALEITDPLSEPTRDERDLAGAENDNQQAENQE